MPPAYFKTTLNFAIIFEIFPKPNPNPNIIAANVNPYPKEYEKSINNPQRILPFTKEKVINTGKTGLQHKLLSEVTPPITKPNKIAPEIPLLLF